MRKFGASYGWLAIVSLLGCGAAASFAGCGGGDSSSAAFTDSGVDATSETDASSGGGDSAQTPDAPGPTGTDTGASSSGGGDSSADTGTSSGAGDSGADTGSGSSGSGADAGDSGSGADAGDSGTRADAGDSGTGADGGDSGADAGDADAGPCTDGTACSIGAVNGVCVSGACAACDGGGSSAGTDAGCTSAYGTSSSPYVCISGSCAPGNCTANSACAAPTPTCGFSTPNFCGGCASDSQCPSGDICNTKASDASEGTCVAAAAGGCTTNQSDAICPLNAGDECCSGSCYPGNCCINGGSGSGCTGAGVACASEVPGETLGGGVCTTCPSVSGASPVYFVDPVHGSDASGTGNNSTSAQCAFRTITRALQFIGTSPQPNTTIDVVGASAGVTITGVASGTPPTGEELFPLTIRSNITVTTSGGPVTIKVAAAGGGVVQTTGFILSGSPSAIQGGAGAALTIDGQTQTATAGVSVQSAGASLSAVTIQNFLRDGIDVANVGGNPSALAVGAGVQSNGNRIDGLFVSGSSSAAITGSATAPTEFNSNTMHGIRVTGTGVITVTGTVGATPPTGSTVMATGNGQAGVWVQTTSTTQSTITGLTSTGSTAGNGIRIIPGSNVKVRSSWVLGNSHGDGIHIENTGGGNVATVANIDLGTAASAGANVVQSASGANPNEGAGICLRLPGGSAVALNARGNVFQNGANCGVAASVLKTAANRACGNGADVGGTIVAFPGGAGDTIDVTMCSYP
jgi:hypothetical protein